MKSKRTIVRCERHRILVVLVFVLLIVVICTGCLDTDDGGQYNCELNIGLSQDISGFYPWIIRDVASVSVNQNFFNGLIELDNRTKGIRPALAQRWTNPDNCTYRFYLREGVTFHNGELFTAEDVNFTLRFFQNGTFYQERLSEIENIIIINNYTIDIKTFEPAPLLLYDLLLINILTESAVTHAIETNESWPVGTGPYQLVDYIPGESIQLKAYDDYWKGMPEIRSVNYYIYDDNEDCLDALIEGEIEICPVSFDDIEKVTTSPNHTMKSIQTVSVLYLGFDCRANDSYGFPPGKNPFSDVRVRKAVYHAIDVDQFIRTRNNISSARPVSQFITGHTFGYNPDIQRLSYNVTTAKHLMKEAGYQEGFSVELDCYDSDRSLEICNSVADQLAAINISVELNPLPSNEHLGKLYYKNTSFFLSGFSPLTAEGAIQLLLHTSDMKNGLGIWNYGNYSNSEVDGLYDLILRTMDPSLRKEYLQQTFSIVMKDVAGVPLYSSQAFYGVHKDIMWDPRPSLYILLDEISFKSNDY
jgi:peptide/nickel transport system substrate-binding protein